MKKCCFIIPYFGKFNSYFQFFLDSCGANPLFDWLIFTDDKREFRYPDNVHVVYCTFSYIRERIQEQFSFPICLEQPYKLCDYRISYGVVFKRELREYDFWGFCDNDMIFGQLDHFITEAVLESYDRILARGHLTLFRNTELLRELYKVHSSHLFVDYRYVFSTKYSCHFDEFEPWLDVCKEHNIKQWIEPVMADIDCNRLPFHLVDNIKDVEYQIFSWNHGTLERLYVDENQKKKDEWLYIHFQKRRMDIQSELLEDVTQGKYPPYLMIRNQFICEKDLMVNEIKDFCRQSFLESLNLGRKKARLKEIVNNVANGALHFRWKKFLHKRRMEKS